MFASCSIPMISQFDLDLFRSLFRFIFDKAILQLFQ